MYRSRLTFALAMAALAAILLPSSLPAQITFQRTYGGTDEEEGFAVQQTSDGGYIVVGYTSSFGAGGEDVYLIKTDANGDTLWTRTCGGAIDDWGYSVQQTANGGYIIVGGTCSYGAGEDDIYLIGTDANGDTLWTKTYGGTGNDEGLSVQQTSDGGYIIAGYTHSFGAGGDDVWLIKTNSRGVERWARTYGGHDYDEGYAVRQTPDGGYIITASNSSLTPGQHDAWLIRTDPDGDTLWTRSLANWHASLSMQMTADGGCVIAGSGNPLKDREVRLAKFDSNGDPLWTRIFGDTEDYGDGYSVQQTADGGYVIAGSVSPKETGDWHVYLVKTDVNGDTMWTRTLGGTGDGIGYSVQQTTDRGYVIAGTTYDASGSDIYLIKTDSSGNVAVAEPKASPTRAPGLSLSCEPNPCRGRTAISLQLTANSPAELAIFDASGRRVRTFTLNRTPCTVWDGTDGLGHALPSGTYFAVLAAGDLHASMRIVLQR